MLYLASDRETQDFMPQIQVPIRWGMTSPYGVFAVVNITSRIITRKIAAATILVSLCSSPAEAVTLPSRMPAFAKNYDAVDPGLAKWMADHIDVLSLSELTSQQVLERISSKDQVERAIVLLELRGAVSASARRRQTQSKNDGKFDKQLRSDYEKALKDVPQIIASNLEKNGALAGPLLQQLFLEWKSIDKEVALSSGFESKLFVEQHNSSCAAKTWALDGISKVSLSKLSAPEIIKTSRIVENYQASSHRRRYLEAVALAIPEDKRPEVAVVIRDLARELPTMFQRHPWLQDSSSKDLPQNLIFAEAMRSVRRKQCQDAEASFEKTLKDSKSKIEAATAIDVGSDIDRCIRAERRSSPQEFWKRMSPKMEERFGRLGSLWVKVRLGYLRWAGNDLVEAGKIFNELNQETKDKSDLRPIEAKSVYYLGKVAEDQNDLELANKYLADYVARFQDLDDFEFSLNSLVVNSASQKKWDGVAAPLERYLAGQSLVHMDNRPVSIMAFSLFWLGRARLETGDLDMAMELWRRLAAEYYSTFYGAMGHYLLEQSSGNSYAIEPARTTGFDFGRLAATMNIKSQAAAERSLKFLQLGLPDQARCEAEEVVGSSPDDYDALLVRTLLLHASGAWLEAIKIYDSIPRSVRNALPIGFERVLFPRKYDEIVKARAVKLGVDPDFVFALMRQESVFAKDATSPVGATGLMQLMPATARLELGKLSSDYVDATQRAELSQILEDERFLRDPEVNVTLGVHHLWRLMQIYKSPVFALTAYNASPAATEKWQRNIATDDWLTFIERIPYKETRAYVKLVLRNYFYYKRWYNSPDGKRQIHIDSVIDGVVALAKNPAPEDVK
jgi:tetratricopeptide (TPR) repeat protein